MNNHYNDTSANSHAENSTNMVTIPSYEELFPAFLFTPNGSRSTNEFSAYCLIKALIDLRIMTAGQLYRWISIHDPDLNEQQIASFISELFQHNLIGKARFQIPIQQSKRIRAGENELKQTTIIYLKDTCKFFFSPDDLRFARFGPPQNINLDRLYHDLLITEAALFLSANYYILNIRSEDKIKSSLPKSNENASNSVPDFEACLYRYNGKDELALLDFVAGEIVVQSDLQDISGKPENILFFTANLRAADLIKKVRKEKVFLLGDVTLPLGSETQINYAYDKVFDPPQALLREKILQLRKNNLYDNPTFLAIIFHLSQHGPLTENALEALTGTKRANISKKLNKMIALKLLHSEDVQFEPGVQRGRPSRLFAFSEIDLSTYEFRLQQLHLSTAIVEKHH